MKCKECKHWTRSPESDNYLPEDEIGLCDQLSSVVDIELKTGWDGGFVESIESKHDFFCAAFQAID